jgi:hypothetical protein
MQKPVLITSFGKGRLPAIFENDDIFSLVIAVQRIPGGGTAWGLKSERQTQSF